MKTFAAVVALLFATVAVANPFYEDLELEKHDAELPDLSKLETVQRQAVSCGGGCRFRFCDGDANLIVGTPDVSASDSICKRGNRNFFVGIVGETGEALVSSGSVSRVPISQYRPNGLSQNFPRSFFKTFRMPRAVTSGVGHQSIQGNQHRFIGGLCVRLPIRSYQRVNRRGSLLNRISTTNPRDCIAFTTEVPRIIIELMWQSGDDLDLHVVEPDGDEVFFGNTLTEAGELLEDVTSFCGVPGLKGRERTVYVANGPIENGLYRISAQHFSNCREGRTDWRIRVFIDGKLRTTRRGTSNQDNNQVINGSVFDVNVNF